MSPRNMPCFDSVSAAHKFMWKCVLPTSYLLSYFLAQFISVNVNSPAFGSLSSRCISVQVSLIKAYLVIFYLYFQVLKPLYVTFCPSWFFRAFHFGLICRYNQRVRHLSLLKSTPIMAAPCNSRWIMGTREESAALVAPCKIRSEKNERRHRRQDTTAGNVTSLLQK